LNYPNIYVCRPIEVQQRKQQPPPPHHTEDGDAAGPSVAATVGELAVLPIMCLSQLRDVLRATVREQQLQQQQEEEAEGDGDGGIAGGNGPPIPIPSSDIIVIALGIWQDVHPRDCRLPAHETITTLVAESIQLLTQMVTMAASASRHPDSNSNSKRMRVIWRTWGGNRM
jgi:hypothetical protein